MGPLLMMKKLLNMLLGERKVEIYDLKVLFLVSFIINSPLKFKSVADIDEASPSEDEEAAQRALRGEEGGDLRPEGFISRFF